MPGIVVSLVQRNRAAGQFVGVHRTATNNDGRFPFFNVHPDDDYFVYTTMSDAAHPGGILLPEPTAAGADGTTKDIGACALTSAVHRLAGRIILTDGEPIPPNTRLLLSREEAWDWQDPVVAADGSFSFAGVPEEAVTLNTRLPDYRLASRRNHFQQVRPSEVALFVDADKPGLELFFEPETANQRND